MDKMEQSRNEIRKQMAKITQMTKKYKENEGDYRAAFCKRKCPISRMW